MKRSLVKHWCLAVAAGGMVPCLLYSAEPTNQLPVSAPVEKAAPAETNVQAQANLQGSPLRARIVYKPPLRGAPAVRIDGGSRGSGVSLICLTVLAPNHTGLTVREQPSLFWYQSAPADVPFELTVIQAGKPQPVLRIRLPDAKKSGIQHVNLSDYNVKLSTGIEYEWVVALVVDPESRSKDVIASGFIERVEPSADLSARLAAAAKADVPSIYAGEGIWYDAIEALSNSIAEQPDDSLLKAATATLLSQAGLTNAAAHVSSLVRSH